MATVLSVKTKMNVAKLTVQVKSMDSMKHFLLLMNATKSQPVSTKQAITIALVMMVTMVMDSTVMMSMSVKAIMNVTKMPFVTILLVDITVHAYLVTTEIVHSGDPVVDGVRYIVAAFCYVDLIREKCRTPGDTQGHGNGEPKMGGMFGNKSNGGNFSFGFNIK